MVWVLMGKTTELWQLEAQCVYCIQLNREGGYYIHLHQGGRVYSTQLNKGTDLAHRSRGSLCREQSSGRKYPGRQSYNGHFLLTVDIGT